jgi:hypothetical protein
MHARMGQKGGRTGVNSWGSKVDDVLQILYEVLLLFQV